MESAASSSSRIIEDLIVEATLEANDTPNSCLNNQITSYLISNPSSADEVIAPTLLSRIQNQSNPSVISLSLSLTQACMKTNTRSFHIAIAKNPVFLNEIAALISHENDPSPLSVQAKQLIKEWGMAFAHERNNDLAAFHDTYMKMKIQGVIFAEDDLPESGASTTNSNTQTELQKLHTDLAVVDEKLVLARELYKGGEGSSNVMFVEVMDFLGQCQPRMSTLIEAGISGKLDEATLEICLRVNDELVKVLDGDMASTTTSTSTEVKASPPVDLLSNDFDSLGVAAVPPATELSASASLSNVDDDFDEFLDMRTGRSASRETAL